MGKRNKKHWAANTDDPSGGRKFRLACGMWAWINSAKESGPLWSLCGAAVYRDLAACDPDWHCSNCAKAARLALAKESAPKPASRCATSGCGSYAINPGQSGRDDTSDLNLCDVCYWRKQASDTWPTPRPISEAPKDGSMVLIRLPDHDPQWTIGVFDPRKRWVDLCLVGSVVEPTHFLPLPPKVKE